LYRTVVHVQNGARRQLRAPGESSPLGREFFLGRESPPGTGRRDRVRRRWPYRGEMAACRRLRERSCQDLRARPPGNAGEAVDVVAERAGAPPPSSPVRLSGSIPPLAESFHQRPETGLYLRAGLYPGDTVVLTHGQETPIAPAAQGGTGKTQL